MNIFLDTKKHIIIQRMENIWKKDNNILYLDNYKNCDIQLSLVNIKINTKLPKILRLDGIYYDMAINYLKKNSSISKSHNIADGIIYQSQTSLNMCQKYLKKRNTNNFDIIYNGIQENWAGKYQKHDGINILCTAKWRRWKRLKEIIDIFLIYNKSNPNSKLHIIGKLYKNEVFIHPNIFYYGQLKHKQMTDIYKNSDMFIHLGRNDPCPKTITEAIGMGIPVITTDGCGGATEMCNMTDGCFIIKGDKISLEPDYVYQEEFNKINDAVKKRIIKAMNQITYDKRRVILPDELKIETTARKYIELMKKVI